MTWVTGLADDYIDLFNEVVDVATAQSCSSIDSIAAAGSSYVVGDIVTAAGGTSTHAMQAEVLTVGGSGEVLTIQIDEGGAYSAAPGDPVTMNGGTGSSLTLNLTFTNTGWTVLRRTQEGLSATIDSGGSGYTVGDDVTLDTEDSVGEGVATVFNVDTVSAGAITAVSLLTAGDYEEVQSSPTDIGVTGGTGSGARLDVTFQDATSQEQVVILKGTGSGSDEIFVGMKAYNKPDETTFLTVRNWALVGMTGFNSLLDFENQPGISPGAGVDATGGAFVPLTDDQTPTFDLVFWFSITPSRIIGVARARTAPTTHYMSWYLGFTNPFGTNTEFPYPLLIAGTTARDSTFHSDTETRISGICEVVGNTARTGPMWFRRVDSVWQQIRNSRATDTGSQTRVANTDFTCYPCGDGTIAPLATEDRLVGTTPELKWVDIIPNTGVPGTPQNQLHATPNAGGDLHLLVPCNVIATDGTFLEYWGELDGVFWTSAADGESSEDRLLVGDDRYYIFQNGNRAESFTYMAIKQG